MPVPHEPDSADAVRAWVEANLSVRDRFGHVREGTVEHRLKHGCDAYPTADGPLLGVLARVSNARRILELGTGLGYSALWLAYGAGADGVVETVERDADHVDLARRQIAEEGYEARIRIVHSEADTVLAERTEPCDLLSFDAYLPGPALLDVFARVVRRGGLLVTSNLFLAQYDRDLPGLEDAAAYRTALLDDDRWLTSFADGKALSVRR